MKCLVFISVFLFCSLNAFCQQDTTDYVYFKPTLRHGVKYVFKTSAGTVFIGFVVSETAEFITIENRERHETYELRRSEIKSVKPYSDRQSYSDATLGENYHARNYLITQSAFLFEENKLSTNSHFLLLDNLEYSFSENWAVTANTLAFFYPVSLGVKCAYAIDDNNYVGGNIFFIGNPGVQSGGSLLFGYGAIGKFTRGDSNNNFSITGGLLGISSDAFASVTTTPFVNVEFAGFSLCRRVSKNIAIAGEALYFPELSFGLAGAGIKLVANPHSCWTLGCFGLLSGSGNNIQLNYKAIPIPYFGVARVF